jgi:LysM repeat protein
MIKKGIPFFLVLFGLSYYTKAQNKLTTPEEYISTYKDIAVSEMKRTGIPASITLAQGLIESSNGNSELTKKGNNHFGIKCKTGWTGKSIYIDDDELQECFRAYDKAEDSYKDHSDFLTGNTRYAFLFQLDPTDYKGWARGLKQAGYATNPKYADMVIGTIEKYSLYQYDAGNKKVPNLVVDKPKETHKNIFGKTIARQENLTYNNIPAYVIKTGDDYQSIANDRNMMRWEIRKYNDLYLNEPLKPGTVIYLKPKRRKAREEYHIVKEGEGMYDISQVHGMKLRLLYKWNQMEKGQEPATGEKLYLRHKRDAPPKLLPPGTVIERKGIRIFGEEKKVIPTEKLPTDSGINQPEKKNDIDGFEADDHGAYKYHIVQPGETLTLISQKYGIALEKLNAWNKITGEVSPGQKLYMTRPWNFEEEKKPVTPVPDKNPLDNYVVSRGETLYSISEKMKVAVDSIIKYNHLNNYSLFAGQQLKLRLSRDESLESQNGDKIHVVVSGETLYSIAKKYHVTVEELVARNGLKDNSIYIGQSLKIKD